MNIRFYNAYIYTGKPEQTAPMYGEIWVVNDKIKFIGTPGPETALEWGRQIDCRENLLMPGFKNAHAHSGAVFLRSFCDDKPLRAWLDTLVPFELKLSHEDFYELTKLAIMEYLSSGITAAFEMYYDREASAGAAVDTGYRFALAGGFDNHNSTTQLLADQFEKYNHYHPLVTYQLGFHAEYSVALPLLKEIAEIAENFHAPVYTHNSETKAEVDGCKERYGKTPTQLLYDLGLFKYGGGGYHCIYLDDTDEQIFLENNLYVVTNSSSNLKLASGIAPVDRYIKKGIPVAIGTDGAASNNCLDFFREMFLMTGLQKVQAGARAMPALNVLQSACAVGARAMHIPECEVLDIEKQADIVLINLHRPNMQPRNNMLNNIVYSGSKENVLLTMVAGKILYENGDFYIGEDAEKIYEKVNKIAAKILRG
jgi:5-methylthioadenosine/S-adenosylhomocysteine deaminase